MEEDEEESINPSSSNQNENLSLFIAWLEKNNVLTPKICILADKMTNERSVVTKTDILQKEYIFKLPLEMIITSKYVKENNPIIKNLLLNKNLPKFQCQADLLFLVVHVLLHQNDKEDFFFPYYNILPKEVSHFPIFWTDSELEYLKGSEIIDEIKGRLEGFKQNYSTLCKLIPTFSTIASFKEFCRIRCLVGSRNFGIRVNDEKLTTLVPFADMLNHTRPPQTRWTFENRKNCFTIKSVTHIKKHTEVFDSYGAKSNSEYFLFYGFVVENNQDKNGICRDTVIINFKLDSDSLLNDKLHIFNTMKSLILADRTLVVNENEIENVDLLKTNKETKNIDLFNTEFELTKGTSAQVLNLLTFLRVKVSNIEEITKFAIQNNIKPLQTDSLSLSQRLLFISMLNTKNTKELKSFISLENELKVVKCLANECKKILKTYPNTLQHNKQTLKLVKQMKHNNSKDFDYKKELSLKYIISEQRIYHFWINVDKDLHSTFPDSEASLSRRDVVDKLKELIIQADDFCFKTYYRKLIDGVFK